MCVLSLLLFHASLFVSHGMRVSQGNDKGVEAWFSSSDDHADSASEAALTEPYDVIVVGAGLTGSAFAGRLAEVLGSGKRALLLEAGGESHSSLFGFLDVDPPAACTSWFDGGILARLWSLLTSWRGHHCAPWNGWRKIGGSRWDVPGNYPVLPCWDNRCPHGWPGLPSYQCKILGGCGVSNGGLMQHPSPHNFDSWPDGWHWDQLQPYYDEIERRFSFTGTPSTDGRHYLDDTGSDVLRRSLSAAGFRDEDAPERPRANTMGIPRVAAHDGVRESTASVMLPSALSHPGITLRLHAEVSEILFDDSRATGVRYNHRGVRQTATLKPGGRVVLAAGAFNSPRILLNSGVGPGMPINNEGVGRGISDHTITSVTYTLPSNSSIGYFNYESPSQQAIDQYINNKSGPLAQYGPTLAAFFKNEAADVGDFDVEIFVNPAKYENEMQVWFILMKPDCSSADLSVSGRSVRMDGTVHLGCESDRKKMQSAIDLVGSALAKVGAVNAGRRFGWPRTDHMNHWAGSCKLDSCVDAATLIVHGTDNVAVVDASILPSQIWGHPALSLKAFALKAVDLVARQM